jgi:heat shock protein HtpX
MSKLSTEELRAVIGHEIGHIINGDATTALHLVAINTGFYFVFETAAKMLRNRKGIVHFKLSYIDFNLGKVETTALAMAVVGLGTYAIGRIFELWVSRSREYVADACAVAYTGNNKVKNSKLTTF